MVKNSLTYWQLVVVLPLPIESGWLFQFDCREVSWRPCVGSKSVLKFGRLLKLGVASWRNLSPLIFEPGVACRIPTKPPSIAADANPKPTSAQVAIRESE